MSSRIGVVVARTPVGISIRHNVEAITAALSTARSGDVVVTPEGSLSGYPVGDDQVAVRTPDADEVAAALDVLAVEASARRVCLFVGICGPHGRGGAWFNDAVGLLSDGTSLRYRKVDLATAERGRFGAGDDLPVFGLPARRDEVTVGLQICREVRFPEQWRLLAQRGAQLFLHLNHRLGTDPVGLATWRAMLIARAAENQRFVASANAASRDGGSPSIDAAPDGSVLGESRPGTEDAVRVEADMGEVADWYLDQRRRDLVDLTPDGRRVEGEAPAP
ncbi:MAG: carbon-nitrogen hydrolase family protein [Gemmatimonadota bacterium]